MTRDELIKQLQAHRDNDVRVYVPREGELGAYVLDIESVEYVSGEFEGDFLAIDTSLLIEDQPEPASIDDTYELIGRHFAAIAKLRAHIVAVFGARERDLRSAALGAAEITEAEERVARMLPSRMTYTEIAAELFLSPHTVKSHMKSIYRKLGAKNRTEAVAAMSANRKAVA